MRMAQPHDSHSLERRGRMGTDIDVQRLPSGKDVQERYLNRETGADLHRHLIDKTRTMLFWDEAGSMISKSEYC